MVKTNIEIVQHEDKTSKNGKDYTRFKCKYSNGSTQWMSAFETDLIKNLKENENKLISVEVIKPDGSDFYNLREFYKINDNEEEMTEKLESTGAKVVKEPQRDTSFYTAYAKDIFIAYLNCNAESNFSPEDLMDICINMVKKARKAFS